MATEGTQDHWEELGSEKTKESQEQLYNVVTCTKYRVKHWKFVELGTNKEQANKEILLENL